MQGAGSLDKPLKVVGVGSCGVDYLASVASYPRPDEKLRTEQLEVRKQRRHTFESLQKLNEPLTQATRGHG